MPAPSPDRAVRCHTATVAVGTPALVTVPPPLLPPPAPDPLTDPLPVAHDGMETRK